MAASLRRKGLREENSCIWYFELNLSQLRNREHRFEVLGNTGSRIRFWYKAALILVMFTSDTEFDPLRTKFNTEIQALLTLTLSPQERMTQNDMFAILEVISQYDIPGRALRSDKRKL